MNFWNLLPKDIEELCSVNSLEKELDKLRAAGPWAESKGDGQSSSVVLPQWYLMSGLSSSFRSVRSVWVCWMPCFIWQPSMGILISQGSGTKLDGSFWKTDLNPQYLQCRQRHWRQSPKVTIMIRISSFGCLQVVVCQCCGCLNSSVVNRCLVSLMGT